MTIAQIYEEAKRQLDKGIITIGEFSEIVDRECQEPIKWIPVSERLPEEKIKPITEDFYEYQCTVRFGDYYDVRSYKFGDGHWWFDGGLMDGYVTAWMPIPEPYKSESEDKK